MLNQLLDRSVETSHIGFFKCFFEWRFTWF